MASELKKTIERELDPIHEWVFRNKMEPYIEWAREWWLHRTEHTFFETGSYPAEGAPIGMCVRFSRTLSHSPIKGIQAFPYVNAPYLQLHHSPGGSRRLVERLCGMITIDEFTLIPKKYLHGTERTGQFICIVPTDLLAEEQGVRGRYVWFSGSDLISLSEGMCDKNIRERLKALLIEK